MPDSHDVDYNSMSDDEFMNQEDLPLTEPVSDSDSNLTPNADSIGDDNNDVDENNEVPGTPEIGSEDDSDATSEKDTSIGDTDDDDEEAVSRAAEDNIVDENDEHADAATKDQDAEPDTDEATDIDFEASYKEIMAPFKASGKEVTAKSPEDVRRLMQMGAGFADKMRQIKPYMKIVKSLKEHNLLDQEKVDYLIDLSKKDPKAIAKLLKDGDINPLDIDTTEAGNYKPKNYGISDVAYNLDEAIESIKESKTYDRSMHVLGEQWDEDSRKSIVKNPEVITIIDSHMQNGVFDTVQGFVDNERTFGRLTGMSDLDAYQAAAKSLAEQGVLVSNGTAKTPIDNDNDKTDEGKPVAKPKIDEVAKKREQKRKAAAPSGGKAKSLKAKKDLSKLSDEEFLKQFDAN